MVSVRMLSFQYADHVSVCVRGWMIRVMVWESGVRGGGGGGAMAGRKEEDEGAGSGGAAVVAGPATATAPPASTSLPPPCRVRPSRVTRVRFPRGRPVWVGWCER